MELQNNYDVSIIHADKIPQTVVLNEADYSKKMYEVLDKIPHELV